MFLFPIASQSTAETETAMDPGRPNTAAPSTSTPGAPSKKTGDSSKWLVLAIGAVVFLVLFGSSGKK